MNKYAQLKPGKIVKVGPGPNHGNFIGLVDHTNGAGQPYVLPIGCDLSPKYLHGQDATIIPEDKWTDQQFREYARWRDDKKK